MSKDLNYHDEYQKTLKAQLEALRQKEKELKKAKEEDQFGLEKGNKTDRKRIIPSVPKIPDVPPIRGLRKRDPKGPTDPKKVVHVTHQTTETTGTFYRPNQPSGGPNLDGIVVPIPVKIPSADPTIRDLETFCSNNPDDPFCRTLAIGEMVQNSGLSSVISSIADQARVCMNSTDNSSESLLSCLTRSGLLYQDMSDLINVLIGYVFLFLIILLLVTLAVLVAVRKILIGAAVLYFFFVIMLIYFVYIGLRLNIRSIFQQEIVRLN
jgi:hypothetical protein